MSGSGLFSDQSALKPHLIQGASGIAGEVGDLRRDVGVTVAPMAAITVEEFTNPVAADDDAILLAKDTLDAEAVTYDTEDLDGAVGDGVMSPPRNVTVTTTGTDSDFVNASVVTVHGKDINGDDISEAISILVASSPGTFVGAKAFARVTSITVAAQGTHTDGTISVGFGAKIGLAKKLMARAGLSTVLMEIEAGSKVTTGTIVGASTGAPNGTYAPANAPNAARDYAVYYEYDPLA
jgi:hypothetical protein